MHRLVNGIRVELTPEEEARFLEESKANRFAQQAEIKAEKEKKALEHSAFDKLLVSLTDEEKQIIKTKLNM